MKGWFTAIVLASCAALTVPGCGAKTGLLVDDEEPEIELPPETPQVAPVCSVFTGSSELAALDVFFMLDTSGSMALPTPNGVPKLRTVGSALTTFFLARESAGIGVALDYFPALQSFVSERCTVAEGNDACGTNGACTSLSSDAPCTDDECWCSNREGCNSVAYETPSFPIAQLPAAQEALFENFNAEARPGGSTPTLPALTGVLELATSWLEDNPDHEAIVVLATDGIPTSCRGDSLGTAEDVTRIADVAARGVDRGVRTFVVGVFSEEEAEESQTSLDLIAAAGGSDAAYIATLEDASANFLDALNQIRLTAKACELSIGIDDSFDPSAVWVRLEPEANQELWVERVADVSACGEAGGFYFDPPPNPGDRQLQLTLCQETCTVLGASPNRRAEVFTDCIDPREQ